MSGYLAALPMYDWPEVRADNDALWARLRDDLRAAGVPAPESLTRRNAANGDLDPAALWRHPKLLLAQTCWGPMEMGLAAHVQVVGQPDYSDCEGGEGELYSSAVVMRRPLGGVEAPSDGRAMLPLDLMRSKRFAFNSADSMSGILALTRDLQAMGESLAIFSERIETGGHRASANAVAEGRANVTAIDCRSWKLFKRFEPAIAARLQVVGWTAHRKGLPFITAKSTPGETIDLLRQSMASAGMLAG